MKYMLLGLFIVISGHAQNWNELEKQARGSEVRFALWGGSENINTWVDKFLAPKLKSSFDINLKRIPLSDTEVAVKKIARDKKANRKKGSIDLLWVNGENFKFMKQTGLTRKAYLKMLPNAAHLDLEDPNLVFDFGESIDQLEVPWGRAQFVHIYNTKYISSPPQNTKQLREWVKKNPGKFTYTAPPDFTGSAYLRVLLLDLIGEELYLELVKNQDKEKFKKQLSKLWSFLKEIRPYLYKKGKFYPKSIKELHQLYSDGLLTLSFDYYPTTAARLVNEKVFPKTTKTYVYQAGTVANTHYTSIAFNAPNEAAALIVSNFLISPEAQLSKQGLKNWGDMTVLDLHSLSKKQQRKFSHLDLGEATLSLDKLQKSARPELPADFIQTIEQEWRKNIIQ